MRATESISQITHALNDASRFSPNHPNCGTTCVVTLYLGEKELPAMADWHCLRPENEALIVFYSNVTWGLHLATYRSRGLGRAIDRAVMKPTSAAERRAVSMPGSSAVEAEERRKKGEHG